MKKNNSHPAGSNIEARNISRLLSMKPRLLIADDDPSLRDIFQIIFEKEGYEVDIRENGEDLLYKKFRLPDIFLIDKLLSGIDGLEICRYLKNMEETRNIPVVIVSASPDIGPLSRMAGADDFVEKPFEMTHLLSVISKQLALSRETNRVREW